MRSKTIPEDAEVLRTYDELREFRDSFFRGEFYFLLIVGRQGLSKSWDFEERCRPHKDRDGNEVSVAHYVKGNVSPVVAYQEAYLHRNKLLVLDDAERLWADTTGRYLLRDLTECKPRKWAHWRTDNKTLEKQGVPQSFETSSRVCLIMNRFAFGDAHEYDAIVDRAQFIYFDPTPLEIHKNAALWFWDQEIFDFVADHLHLIDPNRLSARTYVKAYERKPKGDWQEFIVTRCCRRSAEEWVIALGNDRKYGSEDERVAEFTKRTGLKRSTYFTMKKAIKSDGQLRAIDAPRYTLTAKPPATPNVEEESRAALEEERRRAALEEERRRAIEKMLREQEEQEYEDLEDKFFGEDEEKDDDEN